MIVIDSSALTKYLLREEGWREVEGYLLNPVYSVDHVVKEVSNAVWRHAVVRKYVSEEAALTVYTQLKKLVGEVITLEPQSMYIDKAFSIAISNKITVYDALYIAQALKHGELLTSDRKQASVARKLNVKTIIVE